MATTLLDIEKGVRQVTRSPSDAQLPQADLRERINSFILHDLPDDLRLMALRTNFVFYTQPFIDTYESSTDPASPLFDFKNRFISFHHQAYIAGIPATIYQDQAQFYNVYRRQQLIRTVGTGDGATLTFTGTLSQRPVLRNNVLFASITDANAGLRASDDGAGNLVGDVTAGTIDYVTGVFSVSFSTAPGTAKNITAQTVPYRASQPSSILYFDNKFVIRPVADQPYEVSMEAYRRPDELVNDTDNPVLNQWADWIIFGTSEKIFESRNDEDSIARIKPRLDRYAMQAERRTLAQRASQRTMTIFVDQTGDTYYWGQSFH